MKLRIQDNSIRFRLTRSEVDQLHKDGSVTARTAFPNASTLTYAVETSSLTGQPRATFAADRVAVQVPATMVTEWATTEKVSISAVQALEDNKALSILVEKDFACLAPREGEDESDQFPNPLKGQETC